jgi:hypothetical protein
VGLRESFDFDWKGDGACGPRHFAFPGSQLAGWRRLTIADPWYRNLACPEEIFPYKSKIFRRYRTKPTQRKQLLAERHLQFENSLFERARQTGNKLKYLTMLSFGT